MSLRSRFLALSALLGLSVALNGAEAQEVVQPLPASADADGSFTAYVRQLAAEARSQGVSDGTISAMTAGLTPNSRVIALDRAQPAGPPGTGFPLLAPYISDHIDRNRIDGGKRVYLASSDITRQIEFEYGVPAQIVIAIWGHETNYGTVKGDFDLARSLASLAWEGRRRELFAQEFVDLLKIADTGVPRSTLVGSYAGAFGNPQFLPSVYLRLARDGDGDGRIDIWRSEADALASIANYFVNAGWRPGRPWGVPASAPPYLDRAAVGAKVTSPRCPRVHDRHTRWLTVAEWRAKGVTQTGGPRLRDDELVTLLEPDGPGATAYLLTGNYRVILDYNCSNFYALSVGLLADAVAQPS